jgi:predicted KAP-like P-loop ATPase
MTLMFYQRRFPENLKSTMEYRFLEKFIQVSFRVPRPQAFDLRRWLQQEVKKLFSENFETESNAANAAQRRLHDAIYVQGGRYLDTPRQVVRAINALRLHAIPVKEVTDLADMIWLQLIRLKHPKLYEWIEEYVTDLAALHDGASTNEESRKDMASRLDQLINSVASDPATFRRELAQLLPGVPGHPGANQQDAQVFVGLRRNSFDSFVRDKRLASPQHFRFYFAFAQPSGALSDEQVHTFLSAAQHDRPGAVAMIKEMAQTQRPQGGIMAEVLVGRLSGLIERVPEEAMPGILFALANCMDIVGRQSRDDDFGRPTIWHSAERLVEQVFRRVDDERRPECIKLLFEEGEALGWITSIFRSEIFSHGWYGDQQQAEDQRLLRPAEFEAVREIMLGRYRTTSSDTLLEVPNLVSLLYGWLQGSRTEEARSWSMNQVQSDAGLLKYLSRARGWAASDKVYYPLKAKDLENFIDVADAQARVKRIADDEEASEECRAVAQELLSAFEEGRD